MNIVIHEKPDIYGRLHEKFGVEWEDGVIITYQGSIYCKHELPKEKMIHENVHIVQQNFSGSNFWWDRYLEDSTFRLREEVEAYRAEAAYIQQNIKDRNKRYVMLRRICLDLASSMYGNICNAEEAKQYIFFNKPI